MRCWWVLVSLALTANHCVVLEAQRHHKHHHGGGCPSCAEAGLRLALIKRQILTKLGLRTKPVVTPAVPRAVVLATLSRAGEPATPPNTRPPEPEPDDFYGRTSEIITFAEPGYILNGQTLLEFTHFHDLDGEVSGPDLRVKAATLWVRLDFRSSVPEASRKNAENRNISLWVFRVTQPSAQMHTNATHLSGKDFDDNTELAACLHLTLSELGWQKLDLTATIRDWYSSRETARERLRLLVDCNNCKDDVELILFRQPLSGSVEFEENKIKRPGDNYESIGTSNNSGSANDTQRPFLVVHTDPTATRRVRRRAVDCSGALEGQCCKQQFYVSFKQLGWEDWIIAPSGYYANYCRGDCGGPHRTPDTFLNYHTHVMEEYRKMDNISGMQPCCAPLKFSSMSLIYFGPDSNIIKRDLPKMVVDECGCP